MNLSPDLLHCSTGNGGRANAAKLNSPSGLASAANAPDGGGGWLIVRILRVTFASYSLYSPAHAGFWQADTNNGWIRRVFANQTIVAVVGNGTNAAGDDGLSGMAARRRASCENSTWPNMLLFAATATQLNSPAGVSAYDPSGSFYVSDTVNRVVRRIYPNGTARVVAGSIGVAGVTGNNVPGTAALCNYPRALTISGADVVIADSGAHLVRILYANQTLSTLIGVPGSSGSTGDGGLGEFTLATFLSYFKRVHVLCLCAADNVPSPHHHVKQYRLK